MLPDVSYKYNEKHIKQRSYKYTTGRVIVPATIEKYERNEIKEQAKRKYLEHGIMRMNKHMYIRPHSVGPKPYEFHNDQPYDRPDKAQDETHNRIVLQHNDKI